MSTTVNSKPSQPVRAQWVKPEITELKAGAAEAGSGTQNEPGAGTGQGTFS